MIRLVLSQSYLGCSGQSPTKIFKMTYQPKKPRRPPRPRHDEENITPRPAAPVTVKRGAKSHELKRLLAGLGVPDQTPFKPDPFQLEALELLETQDVLVTAPTGSGKTWIAREAIRQLLDEGRRAWYTTPLKALTNSKYQEFCEVFGAENVGILTGDRKENATAPLIVGTTEIYRNQLFDALRQSGEVRADLAILDEAHYLGDEERGHVWEESIILSPPRVRLLLLSATVGNAGEFASWMAEVRGVECAVVTRPGARPVPLRAAFLFPEGQLCPLLGDDDKLHSEITRLAQKPEPNRNVPPWRRRPR